MLTIPKPIHDEMVARARAAAPIEACGILAGVAGYVQMHHPMTNADASAEHYSLIPEEQFAVAKAIRNAGETMLAVWHSHPATPAWPSEEDIRLAVAPGVLHLILSLAGSKPELRAFLIEDGKAEAAPITITKKERDDV
jgi:proteasome lid subunit RPN8/RPN11